MIPRTALLAVMHDEAAKAALQNPWARSYWSGETPRIVAWRGLAAILEPNQAERHLLAEWDGFRVGAEARRRRLDQSRGDAFAALQEFGPVLPARAEQGLTPTAARLYLVANAPALLRALKMAGTCGQMRITARPERSRGFPAGAQDPFQLSKAQLNANFGASLALHIRPVCIDLKEAQPGEAPQDVTMEVLVRAGGEQAVRKAVGRMRSRIHAPLEVSFSAIQPPAAFLAAAVQRPTRRELMKAEILMDTPATAAPQEIAEALQTQLRILRNFSAPSARDDLREQRLQAGRMLAAMACGNVRLAREGIDADPWDIPQFALMRGDTMLELQEEDIWAGIVDTDDAPLSRTTFAEAMQ